MISYLLTGPKIEPVSTADASAHLGADAAESGLVSTLVAAARLHIESVTGAAIIRQRWRLVMDHWPTAVMLPVYPFLSIEAARAFSDEAADRPVLAKVQNGAITIDPDSAGIRHRDGLEVDYWAGHANDAADVPAALRDAVLMLTKHWYDHREAVILAGSGALVPHGFQEVVRPFARRAA